MRSRQDGETVLTGPLLSLRIRNTAGSEAVGDLSHFVTPLLSGETAWDRKIEASLHPSGLGELGFSLEVGSSSIRRPDLFGARQRHGVGEPQRWRELEAWKVGVELAPPSGQIKYRGGFARTRYRWIEANRHQDVGSFWLGDPGWKGGTASWHRIEGTIPIDDSTSLQVFGRVGERSDSFRDASLTIHDTAIFAGETLEFGAKWQGDRHSVFLHSWRIDGAGIDAKRKTIEVDWRGHEASWIKEHWSFDLPLSGGHGDRFISHDSSERVFLSFDLSRLLGSPDLPGWAPHRVALTHSIARSRDDLVLGGAGTNRLLSRGITLSWSGERSLSEIDFSQWTRVHEGNGTRLSKREKGTALSILHSRWDKGWDASFFLTYDGESRRGGGSKSWSGGATFSIDNARWPRISLGVDVNSFRESDVYSRARENGIHFNASVDLSHLFKPTLIGGHPTVQLKAFSDWEASHFDDFRDYRRSGPTILISLQHTF